MRRKEELIPSDGMVGSKLKLLCETAMMQGVENQVSLSKISFQPSRSTTLSSKMESQSTKIRPAKKISSLCMSGKRENASGWSPPSFVPLNSHIAQPLVVTSGVSRAKTLVQTKAADGFYPPPEAIQSLLTANTVPKNNQQLGGTIKDLIRENVQLKVELGEAKKEIARLKKEMSRASCNIRELRSFSGGNKISEIPLADMIEIMQEYGSEISGQSFQKRKENPQPASIVRQFRRWNPDFLKYFYRKNGKWQPKLGKDGELQRRKQKREALRAHRRNPPQGVCVHR